MLFFSFFVYLFCISDSQVNNNNVQLANETIHWTKTKQKQKYVHVLIINFDSSSSGSSSSHISIAISDYIWLNWSNIYVFALHTFEISISNKIVF